MARINRDLALTQQTDRERWSDPASFETAWDGRAQLAAQFIAAGSRVLDLGCGKMALQRFLPMGCTYRGCDLIARDAATVVCDFNAGQFPTEAAAECDIITMLGVLEYVTDVDGFFAHLRSSHRDVVVSYCATDLTGSVDRPSLGWMTHFSFQDLAELVDRHGFRIAASMPVDSMQILMRLTPLERQPSMPPCNVAIISANDISNFGDRLGYHMINSLLPSEADVHHLTFHTLDAAREQYDMVVLGIGNSIFHEYLNEQMLDVVSRGKARVGIFGTQYRELLPRPMMDRLVDRLDIWFARYQDDVMLYGRGRNNVEHLGDWLIDQFPLTTPTDLGELHITVKPNAAEEFPLDRTIQYIQRYRRVFSTRLHPLLCALTSAAEVAYSEQKDVGRAGPTSGKFRSMLIDIFGRTYPEQNFFAVDRDAVARYKARVHGNVKNVGRQLEAILRNVASAASA
jgi:hypothetical protein